MITSSKFFEKAFFSIQSMDDFGVQNQLSPWGHQSKNISVSSHRYLQNNQTAQDRTKSKVPENRGYQISRESSKKYVEKKLQQKHDILYRRPRQQITKLSTLQEKLRQINESTDKMKLPSIEKEPRLKKKKSLLFPQLNMSEFNQLKAKSTNVGSYATIDEVLTKRQHRKRYFEDLSKQTLKKSGEKSQSPRHLPKINKSMQLKPLIASKFVFAVGDNPELSIMGKPTTTFEF